MEDDEWNVGEDDSERLSLLRQLPMLQDPDLLQTYTSIMDKETMGGSIYSPQVLQTLLYVIFALVEVKKQTPTSRVYNDKFIQRVVNKVSRSFKRFKFEQEPSHVIVAIYESFTVLEYWNSQLSSQLSFEIIRRKLPSFTPEQLSTIIQAVNLKVSGQDAMTEEMSNQIYEFFNNQKNIQKLSTESLSLITKGASYAEEIQENVTRELLRRQEYAPVQAMRIYSNISRFQEVFRGSLQEYFADILRQYLDMFQNNLQDLPIKELALMVQEMQGLKLDEFGIVNQLEDIICIPQIKAKYEVQDIQLLLTFSFKLDRQLNSSILYRLQKELAQDKYFSKVGSISDISVILNVCGFIQGQTKILARHLLEVLSSRIEQFEIQDYSKVLFALTNVPDTTITRDIGDQANENTLNSQLIQLILSKVKQPNIVSQFQLADLTNLLCGLAKLEMEDQQVIQIATAEALKAEKRSQVGTQDLFKLRYIQAKFKYEQWPLADRLNSIYSGEEEQGGQPTVKVKGKRGRKPLAKQQVSKSKEQLQKDRKGIFEADPDTQQQQRQLQLQKYQQQQYMQQQEEQQKQGRQEGFQQRRRQKQDMDEDQTLGKGQNIAQGQYQGDEEGLDEQYDMSMEPLNYLNLENPEVNVQTDYTQWMIKYGNKQTRANSYIKEDHVWGDEDDAFFDDARTNPNKKLIGWGRD